jgi:hypothetical protein
MQARGPQWETDGKGKRGFYPTDWRPKVKRILIWLDFAPRKASNLPNLRSEKRVCDHFQDYRGVQKRIIKAKRLALRPGKLRYSIGITGFI